jgi:phage terminase large subunit GpA-like protein
VSSAGVALDEHQAESAEAAAVRRQLHELVAAAIARGLAPLKVPKPVRLSRWAEDHFYLTAEASYVEGRWHSWPFQRALLDLMGSDQVRMVDFRKSKRVGYTKCLLAKVAYTAEHKRRNQLLYQPTDDDRDDFVTDELEPVLRDVDVVKAVFPKFNRKSKDNTLRKKKFTTGVLHLRGGKAAKNYRRLTVDDVHYDELDAFDRDIESEGTATKLGDGRLEGATFPKSIRGTTPKTKGASNIEDAEAEASLRFRYHVACPHCDTFGPIEWGGKRLAHGMKWQRGRPETVQHICQHCGVGMTPAQYFAVWEHGRWIAHDGDHWLDDDPALTDIVLRRADGTVVPWALHPHVALHVWAAYSPQTTWQAIVEQFLSAAEKAKRGDDSELKTFINTVLGETYEERSEAADESELEKRAKAESYALRTVPRGCLLLTAGVDVQDNRFEAVVWGWGRGEEMWVVDHMVLDANPADERDWQRLDTYLQSRFQQEWHGGQMGIEAVAIDTGGHFTHQVYNYVRQREHRRIVGVRGSTQYGTNIKGAARKQDVNFRGQVIKAGVRVYDVGTDTAKDLIYGRLRVMQPGPGYMHFAPQLSSEFFNQLTAEGRVLQRTATGEVYRWVKRRQRNEALDCTVYAIFAAHLVDVHRFTERMWQRLQDAVQPPRDLFAPAEEAAEWAEASPVHTSAPPPPPAQEPQPSTPAAAPAPARSAADAARQRFARQW